MPSGRTRSPLRLGARREKAFELFRRGFSNVEVAEEIQVSPDTAARYRKLYEDRIVEAAREQPDLLRDVLANTIRTLTELDAIRRNAWQRLEENPPDSVRSSLLNTLLKAQDQRSKLFGLLGVKQEYAAHVAKVRQQQEQLIEFMSRELCPVDREKLEEYLLDEMAAGLATLPEIPHPMNDGLPTS
jgi:hypothetical protein